MKLPLLMRFKKRVSLGLLGPQKGNSPCLSDWGSVGQRHPLETTWDLTLVLATCITNLFIILVVSQSHSLWKPRHYLMAALCVANLLLGLQQLFSLGLDLWPDEKLCLIYRMTIGIPAQVNSLLLALVSMDRFVAVRFPFFYESSVNNFRVIRSSRSIFPLFQVKVGAEFNVYVRRCYSVLLPWVLLQCS